ncbi:MAG: Tm-1-like ATP-binding domain-containing protein, partial [Alphaproteobacteria bacterium]|nr:Tm-1-like ATP-binding domain-containing protein [Alphaproteobacteria bacterium]
RFVRQTLEANGVDVIHLDASIRSQVDDKAEIQPAEVAAAGIAAGSSPASSRDAMSRGRMRELLFNP